MSLETFFSLDEKGVAIENEFEEVERERDNVRTKRSSLQVQVQRPKGWLSKQDIALLQERERTLQKEDHEAQDARRLRNEILSNCFKFRDALRESCKLSITVITYDHCYDIRPLILHTIIVIIYDHWLLSTMDAIKISFYSDQRLMPTLLPRRNWLR